MAKNLLKMVTDLFKKVDDTEARYERALEAKGEEVIALLAEYQEKNKMLQDMHKMKLLNEISEEAYDVEKVKVEKIQKKIQESQQELQLIEAYKTDDVKAVLAEIEETNKKLSANNQAEITKLKLELLQAKYDYLQKMAEASSKYNQLIAPSRKIDDIKIKLGMKKMSYVSDAHSALSMVSVESYYENLLVDNPMVYNALQYRQVPSRLQHVVKGAKEKGIIK